VIEVKKEGFNENPPKSGLTNYRYLKKIESATGRRVAPTRPTVRWKKKPRVTARK